jgi:SAM-dependent methyltransferase
VTAAERWLAGVWPVVRARLPSPPAHVVEIGCGTRGGFVPMLRASGYRALGVDPEAPEGEDYRRIEFEQLEPVEDVDVVVASTSLHHVADAKVVVERIASLLAGRGGTLVVVEWAWEDFDEPTARWCFERLGPDSEPGWLHRRRDEWAASGREWDDYLREWTRTERLHSAEALLRLLDGSFERRELTRGPYLFPDLAAGIEDEKAAIEAGQIRATRVVYVGSLR